jgi:hypothetical protein
VTTDEDFSYDDSGPPVHDDEIRESLMGARTEDHLESGGDEDHRVGSRDRRAGFWDPEGDGGPGGHEDDGFTAGFFDNPDDGSEYNDDFGGETPGPRQGTIEYASSGREGSSRRRVSTVRVHQPDFVSRYTEPVWRGAVTRVASAKRLFRKGRVDYGLITAVYRRALHEYLHQAGGPPRSR